MKFVILYPWRMLIFVDFTKTAKNRSTYGSLQYNYDSFWTTPRSDKKMAWSEAVSCEIMHMNNSLENIWASVGPKTEQWSDQWRIWYEDGLFIGHFEPAVVWTMVCKRSEPGSQKRSLDTGLICLWSEVLSVWFGLLKTTSSAIQAQTRFRAHRSMIRCHFGVEWSDYKIIWSGMMHVTRSHFVLRPQPGCVVFS